MTQEMVLQTYDNNEAIRTAVNRLTDLLELIHNDPSPDIFTVRDYRNRYPFTRLGALATKDIDRYQRINRAVGNHVQMGLCEYHIGLIYLHEGAFRGAAQQFDQARQQWSFVNQSAGVSLTFLGRAVALQQATHFESALISAGKVSGWVERARFDKSINIWAIFRQHSLDYLDELQAALRQQLESEPETADDSPEVTDNGQHKPEPSATSTAQPENPPQIGPVTPSTTAEAETRPDGDIVTGAVTPRPISNMNRVSPPIMPLPDHLLTDERYAWYLVQTRPLSDFMPNINEGDWLLVDLQPGFDQDLQDTEQPILVVMNKDIDDTIRIRPLDSNEHFQRIYLVTLADKPRSFLVDQATGTVSFSQELPAIGVNRDEILGVVVGFWRPMIEILSNT